MEFVNQEESDSDDDRPLRLPEPHRKAREKIDEVEGLLAYFHENKWQLGIVNERIEEMNSRMKDINDRMMDIHERTRENSSDGDIGESRQELIEIEPKIRPKIGEFFDELRVMLEWTGSVIPKNKTIKEEFDELVKKIERLKNGESEIETAINQSLADVRTSVEEIRQNITKSGRRLEEIDVETLKIRRKIKQIQGADEDEGDKRSCCVA